MLSAPTVITAPEEEPVTLAEGKLLLRLDAASFDDDVRRRIAAARADVEQATGTRLITQTVEILADSFADLAHLQVGPVQSIAAITYQDAAGLTHTLDPTNYELFGAGLERGIRLKVGGRWPGIRAVEGAIAVRLVVGYGAAADVPPNVRIALLALVQGGFEGVPVSIDTLIVNDRIWL